MPFDYFRFTKFSLLKLSEESYFEVNYINGFGGTMNIMRTQLSLFKNSAKSINHLKRILVAMPLIKIFEILIRISKFIVGDLVHHDCPQGYAVALTKKKINC